MNSQLMIVFYNGKHNAFGGARNQYRLAECPEEESAISKQIKRTLNEIDGYVLVKYKGQMYLCEKNDKNPKGYDRTTIFYHPLQEKFTI